jgi:hypothetical protein
LEALKVGADNPALREAAGARRNAQARSGVQLAVLLPFALAMSAVCQAGTPDIPDEVNARISRAKSEQSAAASERARRKLDDGAGANGKSAGANALGNNGCNIAVGTIVEDDKKIGTSAKRETTVIVTGDIIQAGNNCR